MVLVIRYCDNDKIYGVLEFVSNIDRLTAIEIIRSVKNRDEWWSMEDIWDALEDSELEYAKHDDIDEYYV